MTTAEVKLPRRQPRLPRPSVRPLPPAAWLYWGAVIVPAAAALPIAAIHLHQVEWRRFVLLTLLASLSQLLSFHVNRQRVFHTGLAFTVAAALLLPPELVIIVCAVQHLPEWLRQRYPWFIQSFNIANYMLAGLAAWAVAHAVGFPAAPAREAASGTLAALAFIAVNRLLLLPMLYLGRGLTPRQTGLLDLEDFSLELVLALMAVPLAVLWLKSVALAALATAPLFVVHITQRAVLRLEQAGEEIDDAHQEMVERSRAALEALSATVDARDKYTHGHSQRVAESSQQIARELGLAETELEILGQAARLHDIGKIAVPDAVLLKRGELTQTEEMIMRSHPEEGARIIERLGYLDDVVPGIRHHHERPDGRGYPEGLMDIRIPLLARIIHVADALDAMTTARVYRDALSFEVAMDEIRRGRGTDFCEDCVDALERAVAAGRIGALGRLTGAAA